MYLFPTVQPSLKSKIISNIELIIDLARQTYTGNIIYKIISKKADLLYVYYIFSLFWNIYCLLCCVKDTLFYSLTLLHTFLLAMLFFRPGSNVAQRNSNFPKIGLTLPDKKVFKMLVSKSAIIWQRFQSSVLNIFRDRFWKLANFSLALLIKVLLIKKACIGFFYRRNLLHFTNLFIIMFL